MRNGDGTCVWEGRGAGGRAPRIEDLIRHLLRRLRKCHLPQRGRLWRAMEGYAMNDEKFEFPVLRFVELEERTEEALRRFIFDEKYDYASGFLVCLRQKYYYEKEWEYLIDYCTRFEGDGIAWNNDWYEGQQQVEYLGICVVPGWSGERTTSSGGAANLARTDA